MNKILYILIPIIYFISFLALKCHQGISNSDADTWMHLSFIEQNLNDFFHGDNIHKYNIKDFVDYILRRDNANMNGTELIWTIPYNFVIILFSILFFVLGFDIHQSLNLSSYIIGPCIMFLNIIILNMILSLIWKKDIRIKVFSIIVFVSIFNLILLSYSFPGRVSHHPLTLSFCMLSFYHILKWGKTLQYKSAILSGFFLMLSCWSSMETLPFSMIMIFLIWIICIYRGNKESGLCFYKLNLGLFYLTLSILFSGVCSLFLDHPLQGFWYCRIDRYSIFQLFTLILGLIVALLFRTYVIKYNLIKYSFPKKICSLILVTCIFLLIWVTFVISFVHFPINLSDFYFYQYFWKVDAENLSVIKEYNDISFYMPAMPALCLTLFCMLKSKKHKVFWFYCSFILFGLICIGLCSLRLMMYADMLSVLVYVFLIRKYLEKSIKIFNILLLVCSIFFVSLIFTSQNVLTDSCSINQKEGKIISDFIGNNSNVMTDIWIAPNIIWNTNLNTVSGPYHPNLSGIHDEGVFWIGDFSDNKIEQEIKNIILKRNIKGIISCNKDMYLNENYYSKNTIKQLLHNNKNLSWIDPHFIKIKNLYIYKIK